QRQPCTAIFPYTTLFRSKKRDMVITATTDGKVIVWDKCEALCKENENKNDRRKIKEVQLLTNISNNTNSIRARINFLMNYESYRSEEHTSELQSRENLVC